MIKRIFCILLILTVLVISALPLVGCSKADDGKLTVICTVFPLYDWAKNIIGEDSDIELKLLVSDGSELHSFNATADDAIAIKTADMIIRVGGVSDISLKKLIEKDTLDLQLMKSEGMVLHESDSESHSHSENKADAHTADEHIWLSLNNAMASVKAICASLSSLDPDNADTYKANAEAYNKKLLELDGKFRTAAAEAESPRLIFADRFPFVYLTNELGIEYTAAFSGCSTDIEVSIETVTHLAQRLDEWNTGVLAVTETSDKRLAETIISLSNSKNAEIVVFDSMQTVNMKRIDGGATYLNIMESNLAVLISAI